MNQASLKIRTSERKSLTLAKKHSSMVLHYAVSYKIHGEKRIRSLCNRARADVVNADTIDRGQNVTGDPAKVTCSYCNRILPMRLEKERAAQAARMEKGKGKT